MARLSLREDQPARMRMSENGVWSSPVNHNEQQGTSHKHELHQQQPLFYEYVSHVRDILSKERNPITFLIWTVLFD
jgi:hypothetical protein